MRIVTIVTALCAAMCMAACGGGGGTSLAGIYFGLPVVLGDGDVRAWVELNADGDPVEAGVRFSDGALENLPATASSVSLAFPSQAAGIGYDHVEVDWNPEGHEPATIYDVAHFDFHFYNITSAEQAGIVADDARFYAEPPANELAPGYVMFPGTGVPNMGTHFGNPASPELNGQPFTYTFIYGYYDGGMVFAEPMIAKSYLDGGGTFAAPVPVPAVYPETGYFCTGYSVTHSFSTNETDVAMTGLTLR